MKTTLTLAKRNCFHFILLVLLCCLQSKQAYSRWRVGASVGPSISSSQTNLYQGESGGSKPLWTWNAGVEGWYSTKKHFEMGVAVNLNHLVERGYEDHEEHSLNMPSASYMLGYYTTEKRSTFGIGMHIGCTLVGTLGENDPLPGITGGCYVRYGYAINDRLDFTAALSPGFYAFVLPDFFFIGMGSIISFPLSFDITYKF